MNFIEFLKLCIIGLIQGITEPLPISSSAHMIIFSHIFNLNINDLNFEIIINFASTLAIIIFFKDKIFYLFKNTFTNKQNKYNYLNKQFLIKLLVASIPSIIIGLLLKNIIDIYFTSLIFVSIALILTGFINLFSFLFLSKKKVFTNEITYSDSLIIGLMQSIALFPGISRSGATIFGGTSRNITLEKTCDFSFFLYLIASIGALFLSLFDLDFFNFNFTTILIPFIICFFSTLLSIKLFYHRLNKTSILAFSIYAFFIGIILTIICAFA